MSLAGKLAIVTGAGAGIGRAASRILAREGATIVAADLNEQSVQETIKSLPNGPQHSGFKLDVGNADSIKHLLSEIVKKHQKPPTIIINCAGITRDNFLLKLSEEDFEGVLNVNLKGTFRVMKTFVNALIASGSTEGGVIVNIASIVGKYGNIGQANYSASKAGVELLTKTAAKEFGKLGIRCNAILPGFIDTQMTQAVPDNVKAKFMGMIPAGRFGQPEEIGEVIAFLASSKSSYINGASIEVTGGF